MRRREHDWILSGSLGVGDGELVHKAIERLVDAEGIDVVSGCFRPLGQRRADALVSLASAAVAADADPDLATVVVHVEEKAFDDDHRVAEIEGRVVAVSTVQSMLCDARVQVVVERDGMPVGIGRVSRTIPHWLRRLLKHRDNGCRFPSCENTKGVEGHHIRFWRHGGKTDLDNLISLCKRHHHVIHDDEWEIYGNPNERVEFRSPIGRVFTARLPEMDTRVRGFALGLFESV